MQYKSLQSIQTALKESRLSANDLVSHYLQKIRSTAHLNIYIEVFEAEVLAKAAELDGKIKEGKKVGRLFGAVISIKDVICYKDHTVTAGSKILEGFTSQFSATCVQKLLAEDAIIIGRVNCDEFGMGSSNQNSCYGATKNPLDETLIPGGSSGASAAAVASGTCLASIGSDTGGSVRQPAAFCGVVGMKPTYGQISRHGLIAYASSFDQIGVLANHPEEAGLILETMTGTDEFDSTAIPQQKADFSFEEKTKKTYKIATLGAVSKGKGIDSNIHTTTNKLLEELKSQNHQVETVDFPLLDYIVPTYYVLTTAEASTNLSRFDGIRYGHRSIEISDLQSVYRKSRTEGFGKEVKRRIMLGTFVLSSGYYDAYFSKAQKVRRLIGEQVQAIFEDFDFIITPTAPSFPWKIGEKFEDPVSVYMADIFTVLANLTGIPAISIPLHSAKAELPIGLQIMSNKFEEPKLLEFATYLTHTAKATKTNSSPSL